jgi:hypothetical protein
MNPLELAGLIIHTDLVALRVANVHMTGTCPGDSRGAEDPGMDAAPDA